MNDRDEGLAVAEAPPAAAPPPAVELRGVSKAFGALVAVDDLSLRIPRGAVYGFLGPNGAGKTTTIRMLLDIIAPDRGEVLLDGRPRTRDDVRRVGYLPEERGLYKKMKVGWTLEYFARIKGVTDRRWLRAEIDRWLERVGLLGRKHSTVESLSKGNQQKVQFLTTILHEPDLVVLDEPFSGLDPVNAEALVGIIQDLRERGRTVIFSTHIMEQAERLCDYVFMIHGGRKVLDGRLGEVKARFGRDGFVLELDGEGSGDDGRAEDALEGLPVERRSERRGEGGRAVYEVTLRPGAAEGDLLAALARRGGLRRLVRIEPSLHDIFIQLANGGGA